MRQLRAGVIGLGVGEQHLLAYSRSGVCEVVVACDLSEEKLTAARTRYSKIRVTRDPEEVFEDPEIDVVSIASYDDAHAKQVVAALNAGKHVFVEKPICQTLAELKVIKAAWARHQGKLKLGSNLVLRAAPVYQWLRGKVAEGFFGEVFALDGDYLYGRIEKITAGWRRDVLNYSVMAGGGVHLIDLLLWITGQRPTDVIALGNRICTRNTSFRYNDYVAATLTFACGLVARITANFGCVHRHQHVVRVCGTLGTFVYDDSGPRYHCSRNPGLSAVPVTLPALPASKGDLVDDFLRAIIEDADKTHETQMHFDVMSIVAACDESLGSRCWKEVQYI